MRNLSHWVVVNGGVVARLTLEEQALQDAYTATGFLQRIADVRRWGEDSFGVTYTYWGIRSLLDRLKIQAKVTRPIADQADPAAQEAWKKGLDGGFAG